jgi:hypothetical protein
LAQVQAAEVAREDPGVVPAQVGAAERMAAGVCGKRGRQREAVAVEESVELEREALRGEPA